MSHSWKTKILLYARLEKYSTALVYRTSFTVWSSFHQPLASLPPHPSPSLRPHLFPSHFAHRSLPTNTHTHSVCLCVAETSRNHPGTTLPHSKECCFCTCMVVVCWRHHPGTTEEPRRRTANKMVFAFLWCPTCD